MEYDNIKCNKTVHVCVHLEQINQNIQPNTPNGCEECLQTGSRWVHLRLCLTCGHIGCCDSSPNKHGTKVFPNKWPSCYKIFSAWRRLEMMLY
jgi:hypothetical protein